MAHVKPPPPHNFRDSLVGSALTVLLFLFLSFAFAFTASAHGWTKPDRGWYATNFYTFGTAPLGHPVTEADFNRGGTRATNLERLYGQVYASGSGDHDPLRWIRLFDWRRVHYPLSDWFRTTRAETEGNATVWIEDVGGGMHGEHHVTLNYNVGVVAGGRWDRKRKTKTVFMERYKVFKGKRIGHVFDWKETPSKTLSKTVYASWTQKGVGASAATKARATHIQHGGIGRAWMSGLTVGAFGGTGLSTNSYTSPPP